MSILLSPPVTDVLDRLYAAADAGDDAQIAHAREVATAAGRGMPPSAELAELLAGAALPVAPEVGRLLYSLVRATPGRCVVEFGASFGISTIQLAAAVLDAGHGGRVVTTELHPAKAAQALDNLERAGVAAAVDLLVGDALTTLVDADVDAVDLLLLDGFTDLYLPVLRLLQPRLSPGALVVADDTLLFPDEAAPYLAHVREPANGWLSVSLPLDDGLELSTWIGR
jgi:predicted O-methyltransferase YrrM